jgi:hypothetical protein
MPHHQSHYSAGWSIGYWQDFATCSLCGDHGYAPISDGRAAPLGFASGYVWFYNYLEKEYKATELSRALVRMDPYNYPEAEFPMLGEKYQWAKDRLLLVLIDEMNLARTEYYLANSSQGLN